MRQDAHAQTNAAVERRDEPYDVIIIGTGWSGLMACKYCVAEGLRTLVLEGRDTLGGVWAYTDDRRYGGVMKSTQTTSSRCVTEISDFPMPDDYPTFPSHSQINAYLEAYCARFGLAEHIRFNQRVTRLAKHDDVWHVTTSEGRQWLATHVIVASGVHQHSHDVSSDKRFAGYSGTLVHSAAVKQVPAEWAGKTIVVWGGGESASDIATESSHMASKVYFCIPNGQWFVPKWVAGLPPFSNSRPAVLDHTSSRLRLLLSPTHHYSPFIWDYVEYAFGFDGHGQEAWRTAAPYNRSFFNKSAEVLSRVKSGHVIPKRDIDSCQGKSVHFTDGTSAKADCIVTCSGYEIRFPFFHESATPGTDPRTWFKYIFYNEDPTLAFVGFVRPVFGSIPGVAELQCRYVAKVYTGACRLPGPLERRAIIERDARFWNRHFRHTSLRIGGLVDHFQYSNQLAKLIGCYPNFRALFFSSPRRWWQAMTAPWNSCQFWLNEPAHHERIFATLRRYSDDNRANYTLLALAPLLPLFALWAQLRAFLMEHTGRRKRTVKGPPAASQDSTAIRTDASFT